VVPVSVGPCIVTGNGVAAPPVTPETSGLTLSIGCSEGSFDSVEEGELVDEEEESFGCLGEVKEESSLSNITDGVLGVV
jgi:hypothetical protein